MTCATRRDAQRAVHRAEDDEDAAEVTAAEAQAEPVRAQVAAPLIVQAETDSVAYLAAINEEAVASARLSTVGRFGRRKARTEHHPHRNAHDAHTRAVRIRAEANELRSFPVKATAGRVEQERTRQQAAQRERQVREPFERHPRRSAPGHDGPTRGL